MRRLLGIICWLRGHPSRWYITKTRALVVCKRCGRVLPLL